MEAPTMTDEEEDLQLVADYRENGNAAAIDRLVAKYGRTLMSYLCAHVKSRPDAEEIFQDAWMKVIKRIDAFKGGSFKAWLTTIARNSLIDGVRKKRPSVSLNQEIGEDLQMVDTIQDDSARHPASRMEGEEKRRRIADAVAALPEKQKEVFLLRTEQELSFAEIAEMLSIPLNTALGRMHYAVTRLRAELEDLL
jgi:RNA polymerase sigma-70 factor (ECF subfamily)